MLAAEIAATRVPKLALTITEAAEATSISRSVLYEEMAAGRLRSFKINSSRRIHVDDLRAWLDQQRETGD